MSVTALDLSHKAEFRPCSASFRPERAFHWRDESDELRAELRTRAEPEFGIPPFSVSQARRRTVEIDPPETVRRRTASWAKMSAEIVQIGQTERIRMRYQAPLHLLVAYEQGLRHDGETHAQGVPRSTLKDLKRKLTFLPAGCEFHEWHTPRSAPRITYVYIEPSQLRVGSNPDGGSTDLAPRLLFEDSVLWETVSKLKALIESAGAADRHYLEAVGAVLAHELTRIVAGHALSERPTRGGLAAWQQRVVIEYIEEHLAEEIPLTTLAGLARLSPHHFCRAFKQSLGRPPCRYHGLRRIERAKVLLATPATSVTEIGLSLGYSETSSFTAAFRRGTGLTPTDYRRSLA